MVPAASSSSSAAATNPDGGVGNKPNPTYAHLRTVAIEAAQAGAAIILAQADEPRQVEYKGTTDLVTQVRWEGGGGGGCHGRGRGGEG